MSKIPVSFEQLAEKIKEQYGDNYGAIDDSQTNEAENKKSEKVLHYTREEKDKMFAENYKLIYHAAKRWVIPGGIEAEELYESGLLGMIKALNTYDKNKGKAKFSTYAMRCINNEIMYFMRGEKKHREDNEGSKIHRLEESLKTDESGRPFTKADTIEDETNPKPGVSPEQEELKDNLFEVINKCLNETEKLILVKRWELDGKEQMTQKELASLTGMSQANVSKLQKNAEDKIARYLKGINRNPDLTADEAMQNLGQKRELPSYMKG